MKIHPEGVEVLKYFGTILLVLLLIVLRFSDLLPRFYGYLIERGMAKYPERSGRRRHKKFAVSKEQIKKQKIAFWCFLSLLCGLTILEWFVIPQPYAMRKDLIAPVGATIFSAGLLIIFLGPVRDERGSNWTRWTYWATVLSTSAVIMGIGYLLRLSTPKGVVAVLVFGFIPFVWISGFFRQVDQAETELRDLKFTKAYEGTSAPSDNVNRSYRSFIEQAVTIPRRRPPQHPPSPA